MVALTRALEAPRLTAHTLFPVLVVVYLTLMTLIGTRVVVPLFGWGSGILPAEYNNDAFGARLARWDSGYYLTIANEGYSADGAERAFFPLYPLLVRWLSAITGVSVLWCGKLLSIVCFLCAAWLLHRWLLDEFDSTTASWGMAWFCLFPMSFYLVAFYPEALFLLAAIASIYAARRGQFVAAGMAITIAGATRPVAFLLAVPYVVEFVLQRDFRRRRLAEFAGGALLAPLGMLCYLAYLSIQAGGGDPVTHYHSNLEAHWGMSTSWPWQTLERAFRSALYGEGIGTDWFSRVVVWHDLFYALAGAALAIWSFGKVRLSLSIWMLVSVIFFFTSHGPYGYVFEGMPRHVASIVPLYPVLARLSMQVPRLVRWPLLVCSAVCLSLLTIWFASGRWVS